MIGAGFSPVSEGLSGGRELVKKKYDELYKARQAAEAKAKLKELKEEAYEDALRSQYGMNETDPDTEDVTGVGSFFNEDNVNQIELGDRLERSQRQSDSQREMLSGSGGFRRTDV